MRDQRDCREIAAAVVTCDDVQLALILGLLCGSYIDHPDALFWDVLIKYLQKRMQATILSRMGTPG